MSKGEVSQPKNNPKYFIYYNNGYFEVVDTMNMTFLHMIETGVVKVIFNCDENKAWIKTEEGLAKEVKVTFVKGL